MGEGREADTGHGKDASPDGRSARPSPNRQVRGTGVEGEGEAEGRDDGRTVAGESLYSQLWPHGGVYILRWISGHKTAPFSP